MYCQMVSFLRDIESHSYQVTSTTLHPELRVMVTLHIFGYDIIITGIDR